jgi:glycosyltransferase involved in cell wall biosynthesis
VTTFAISMVKDEADIVRSVVEQMLTQVDEVIVADNGSTDGTREILEALPVTLIDDPEVGYYQSRKMTALAELAAEKGAVWVVPFDADEYWTCGWGLIRDVLSQHTPDNGIVTAELYDHVCTAIDPDVADPVARIGWRRPTKLPLPKIACRTAPDLTIEQGNHFARYTVPARISDGPAFVVHHFPYRSVAQLIRKVRNGAQAYAASTLPEHMGAHWRQWGQLSDEQIAELFHKWYWRENPRKHIDIDGECQPPLVYHALP